MSAFRIAVLASGTGTNLQAILDQLHGDEVEVVAVASDKPGAQALDRAAAAGVATGTFPSEDYEDRPARDDAIADWLEERERRSRGAGGLHAAAVGGVHRALPEPDRERPPGAAARRFPGLDAVGQALEHGALITGVTVHFVDEGVDSGPIVLQRPVPVPPSRDRDALEDAIHRTEHALLPEAVRLIAAGPGAGRRGEPEGGPRRARALDSTPR